MRDRCRETIVCFGLCLAVITVSGCADEELRGPRTFVGVVPLDVLETEEDVLTVAKASPPDDFDAAGPEDTGLLQWPDTPESTGIIDGIRYVRITTQDGPSWVSWFEIEVSGTWMQMGGEPFNLALGRPVEVSSSTEDSPESHLVDGDHATPWNAGVFPPATLTMDLLMEAEISEIRLRVSQMPSGPSQHEIELAGADGEFVSTHVFSGTTQDGQWLVWPTEDDGVISATVTQQSAQ